MLELLASSRPVFFSLPPANDVAVMANWPNVLLLNLQIFFRDYTFETSTPKRWREKIARTKSASGHNDAWEGFFLLSLHVLVHSVSVSLYRVLCKEWVNITKKMSFECSQFFFHQLFDIHPQVNGVQFTSFVESNEIWIKTDRNNAYKTRNTYFFPFSYFQLMRRFGGVFRIAHEIFVNICSSLRASVTHSHIHIHWRRRENKNRIMLCATLSTHSHNHQSPMLWNWMCLKHFVYDGRF